VVQSSIVGMINIGFEYSHFNTVPVCDIQGVDRLEGFVVTIQFSYAKINVVLECKHFRTTTQ